ncbi:MAG: metallophosphoesterase [Chloroflexota bacterium]|jgi:Icc protein
MVAEAVYFVHISDTHFGPTVDYSRYGHTPLPCARRLVEIINTMPQRPDFVIHTGDVTAEPGYASYRLAAETFDRLETPVYYVAGNHDTPAGIRRHLTMGPKQDLDPDPDRLSYVFEIKGHRFLVLDARGPEEIEPRGLLPASQLEIVARETGPDGPPLIVFLHYPVLAMNSVWMDENMPVVNGGVLHRSLRRAKGRLRGVFHGHVHQHMQIVRDGISYSSTASVFSQFAAWPDDVDVRHDLDEPPGYSFVHLLSDTTIVHHHTFPRPAV